MVGVYLCKECGAKVSVPQEGEHVKAPLHCPTPNCRESKGWKLLTEESTFEDVP